MPEQHRLGDLAKISGDAHNCPACPHTCIGPAVTGSGDVYVNGMPAVRHMPDKGIHAVCCGPNSWQTQAHSSSVYINSKQAVRKGDATKHCGGTGKTIMGSPNVYTGG